MKVIYKLVKFISSIFSTFLITIFITTTNAKAGVEEGIDIRRVQTILTELCYNPGPIDGAWGKKTELAVMRAYEDNNLKFDGNFNWKAENFIMRLKQSATFISAKKCFAQSVEIKEREAIKIENKNMCRVQELLSQQGYNVGSIDGVLGKKTIDSLAQFYAAQNKKFDGNISKSVIRDLEKVSIKGFSKPDGFSTHYKNHFNRKSNLKNQFYHDNIHRQKILRHFSDDCGVAKITCCEGPRSEWDIDSERVELELVLHPLERQYEMEFLFRSNGPQDYKRRVLIAQFKGHTKKVNDVYPRSDPPVAVYATNGGEVSCVNSIDVTNSKYFVSSIRLRNGGYLTDGNWHHVKMHWKLSKTGKDSLCEVIVDGETIISMTNLKTVPFGLKDRGSARIGPYRDNDNYIESFYFDNWMVSSKQ